MQSWETVLDSLSFDPSKGVTQVGIQRIHGYSRGSVLRIMYELSENKLVSHSKTKPYIYWRRKQKLTGMMITATLRRFLNDMMESETPVDVSMWKGKNFTGIIVSWTNRQLELFLPETEKIVTLNMGDIIDVNQATDEKERAPVDGDVSEG